ncbi:MAG: hypothetical protein ACRDHE_08310, partial [Ktedonobacterales bacterium]
YFDSGAPGNQQVRDLAIPTIFTRILGPGALLFTRILLPGTALFGVYNRGSLVDNVTLGLVNTIPALLGLLLALLLWLRLGRLPRLMALAVSALVLLCAGIVAVEFPRQIQAMRAGSMQGAFDATHIGSIHVLESVSFPGPTTTFAWGYYLLVAALLIWAVGLTLVFMAPRRSGGMTRRASNASSSQRMGTRRDWGTGAALLGLGVVAWIIGANYLPWLTFTCPSGIVNNIHYACVSGSASGNVVFTLIAQLPAQSQSYMQINSQRLISPSILNVGNDVVFGSFVPFAFIALVGLGAAIYALLIRQRRTWGYWAYLAFVAIIMAVLFARTRTIYDGKIVGALRLQSGVFVTVAGMLLMSAAVVLLQRASARGPLLQLTATRQ